ncbi:hypothetical protein N7492_000089 [Penicillium capsulatum]|uniref:Uncharacterized protein n=1 Tax=Penicillium capsulatum TaxID=69766 RepID=A0A9W9INT7_9EURO|nr:hypothetical protein N7492_000089 [Penicillium capsulatum]
MVSEATSSAPDEIRRINPAIFTRAQIQAYLKTHYAKPSRNFYHWKRKSRQILAILMVVVSLKYHAAFVEKRTAPEAWKTINAIVRHRSQFVHIDKMQKFVTTIWEQGQLPTDFVTSWRSAYGEVLMTLGEEDSPTQPFMCAMFLSAASHNPSCHDWIESNKFTTNLADSLDAAIDDFLDTHKDERFTALAPSASTKAKKKRKRARKKRKTAERTE